MHQTESLGQTTTPDSSYPTETFGTTVLVCNLRRPKECWRWLRLIASKQWYGLEVVGREYALSLLAIERLHGVTDPGFRKKYMKSLRGFTEIILHLRFATRRKRFGDRRRLGKFRSYLLRPASGLFGEAGRLQHHFEYRRKQRTRVRPKSFIGRGYRDHGTARRPAWDNSPPWQEVAAAENLKATDGGLSKSARPRLAAISLSRNLEGMYWWYRPKDLRVPEAGY